jgi:hypothetical protein
MHEHERVGDASDSENSSGSRLSQPTTWHDESFVVLGTVPGGDPKGSGMESTITVC